MVGDEPSDVGVRAAVRRAEITARGEFYSFFLFSLTGMMLCASADDLIFLFLALELTSLPTYVMVALSTARNRSMEAEARQIFAGYVQKYPAQRKELDQVSASWRLLYPPPPVLEQVKAYQIADVSDRLGKPLAAEVQVVTLGPDLAFVALPGEVFVELGLSLKAASPFKNTIVAELSNGSVGYVPTRTAYPHGNYEVISARCRAGSGEKLVDAALVQLRTQFKTP